MFIKEELESMSLTELRLLDIKDPKEEELVQEVIKELERDLPPLVPVYTGDVPDIKTPEEEARWQEVLDTRAKINKEMQGVETEMIETLDSAEETLPEASQPLTEAVEPAPEAPVAPIVATIGIVVPEKGKPKCEYCDTKSPSFHKKNCTRPNK